MIRDLMHALAMLLMRIAVLLLQVSHPPGWEPTLRDTILN